MIVYERFFLVAERARRSVVRGTHVPRSGAPRTKADHKEKDPHTRLLQVTIDAVEQRHGFVGCFR